MKAIVLVVDGDEAAAQEVSRLIASVLPLNGYSHDNPAVIDWPVRAAGDEGGKR